jgi:hypothetical protein
MEGEAQTERINDQDEYGQHHKDMALYEHRTHPFIAAISQATPQAIAAAAATRLAAVA